jgi:hypothetical protein
MLKRLGRGGPMSVPQMRTHADRELIAISGRRAIRDA